MIEWIRQNRRKVLATFTAVLMVMFILPAGFGRQTPNPVVANYAAGSVRREEFFDLRRQWETLSKQLFVGSPAQPLPIASMIGNTGIPNASNTAMQTISEHPDTFLVLVKEAQDMGLHVSDEQVDNLLSKQVINNPTDPRALEAVRKAVRNMLMVDAAYRRVGAAVKVSQPIVQQEITRQIMQLKVGLVEFAAENFKAAMPAPSDEQVKSHFEKYAGNLAGKRTDDNRFGFGYQVPDRVKIQYLTLDPAQVREKVMGQKQPYEWEVLARKYYLEHESEFAASTPATTAPSTAPSVRPFAEVKEDAISRVVQPEVERLTNRISSGITERLQADFQTFSKENPTPTATDTGYGSYAYLEQVAQDIQKQYGILPTVQRVEQDWLSGEDLSKHHDIGNAWGDGGNFASMIGSAAPFTDNATSSSLKLLEFSKPLKGFGDRQFFVRMTAADKAHRPESLDVVREKVIDDLKLLAGYEKAKQEATALHEQAKAQTLQAIASSTGREFKVAGPIRGSQGNAMFIMPIPGYDPGLSYDRFQKSAFDLLSAPARDSTGTPVSTMELPEAGKVLVATVVEGNPGYTPEQASMAQAYFGAMTRHRLESELQEKWFDFANASGRVSYKAVRNDEADESESNG